MQSAYRTHHCTETALIKVHSDICAALDEGSMAVLIMLDLSAAFDTIDHNVLLTRLYNSLGIRGIAHRWISSYLKGRTQSVVIKNCHSKPKELPFCIPQGSVLGPKFYCKYCRPLGRIAANFGLCYHCFADDSQLYIVLKSLKEWNTVKRAVEGCIREISFWMDNNLLKLNEEKTDYIVFLSRGKRVDTQVLTLNFGQTVLTPSKAVKDLGSWWDSHMLMDKQISVTCKNCYFYIRKISRIRPYITTDTCRTLVQSYVTSRLDYGNAILAGLPYTQLSKLELVQNCAARLITGVGMRAHITPVLRDLHWLPIEARIKFKLLVYAFKCFSDIAPKYLQELLPAYNQSQDGLRSNSKRLAVVPKVKTRYGEQTFQYAAASLWNSLPNDIRGVESLLAYRRLVKTYLFKMYFN